jgi:hypothetical protein
MGHSQFDDASRKRTAWNAGKKVGTKRPFTQKQIWAIRFFAYGGANANRLFRHMWSNLSCSATLFYANYDNAR